MSNTCRRPCKECPWTNDNKHNEKFRDWSDRMSTLGKQQACHMQTKDVWNPIENNLCVGKLMRDRNIRKDKPKNQ